MAHWIVTKDHITTAEEQARYAEDPKQGLRSRVGWGTEGAEKVLGTLTHLWRVYDDDGELYYEGRASEESFDPLDWAKYDAGATEIHYLQPSGKWEQL